MRFPHKVLPTITKRFSITLWFIDGIERDESIVAINKTHKINTNSVSTITTTSLDNSNLTQKLINKDIIKSRNSNQHIIFNNGFSESQIPFLLSHRIETNNSNNITSHIIKYHFPDEICYESTILNYNSNTILLQSNINLYDDIHCII